MTKARNYFVWSAAVLLPLCLVGPAAALPETFVFAADETGFVTEAPDEFEVFYGLSFEEDRPGQPFGRVLFRLASSGILPVSTPLDLTLPIQTAEVEAARTYAAGSDDDPLVGLFIVSYYGSRNFGFRTSGTGRAGLDLADALNAAVTSARIELDDYSVGEPVELAGLQPPGHLSIFRGEARITLIPEPGLAAGMASIGWLILMRRRHGRFRQCAD